MNLLPTKADFSDARIAPGTDLIAGLTVAVVALPLAWPLELPPDLAPKPASPPQSSRVQSPQSLEAANFKFRGQPVQ
jgi:hypothetical protein